MVQQEATDCMGTSGLHWTDPERNQRLTKTKNCPVDPQDFWQNDKIDFIFLLPSMLTLLLDYWNNLLLKR